MPLYEKGQCANPREVEEIAKRMVASYQAVAMDTEADHSQQGELLRILEEFLKRNGM